MKRSNGLTVAPAAVLLLAAAPTGPTLDRAWSLYNNHKFAAAQAAAREFAQANGPSFKAAFLIAVAQCELFPHRQANVAALRQLQTDFIVSDSARSAISFNMKICGPQEQSAAGMGGFARAHRRGW